jgi:hypothetical protein
VTSSDQCGVHVKHGVGPLAFMGPSWELLPFFSGSDHSGPWFSCCESFQHNSQRTRTYTAYQIPSKPSKSLLFEFACTTISFEHSVLFVALQPLPDTS